MPPINKANHSVAALTSSVDVTAAVLFPIDSSKATIVPSVPIKPPGRVVIAPINVETQ